MEDADNLDPTRLRKACWLRCLEVKHAHDVTGATAAADASADFVDEALHQVRFSSSIGSL